MSFASEFPNDNAELHRGAVWVCPRLVGGVRAIVRLTAADATTPGSAAAPAAAPAGAVNAANTQAPAQTELAKGVVACSGAVPNRTNGPVTAAASSAKAASSEKPKRQIALDAVSSTQAAPAVVSGYARLLAAMTRVATERGASRAAALLPNIFSGAGLDEALVPKNLAQRLVAERLFQLRGARLQPTSEFALVRGAWQQLLDGISSDFSGCGAKLLDQWSADVLTILLELGADKSAELRRALRAQGVAAFGMLDSVAA